MQGPDPVWLVGMMGAGKSSVGRALAQRLGRRFADTDAEVERASGMSISEIFERQGEAAFRVREWTAIEALQGEPCVVALGGGAIAQPGAAQRLAASGTLVYLRARPEVLLERVGDGAGRPLLEGAERTQRLERLRSLLSEREAHYARATIVVDTDDLAVEQVAEAIAQRLAVTQESPRP